MRRGGQGTIRGIQRLGREWLQTMVIIPKRAYFVKRITLSSTAIFEITHIRGVF